MKYEKILHITTLTLAYLPTLIFQGQETITVDRVNAGHTRIFDIKLTGYNFSHWMEVKKLFHNING